MNTALPDAKAKSVAGEKFILRVAGITAICRNRNISAYAFLLQFVIVGQIVFVSLELSDMLKVCKGFVHDSNDSSFLSAFCTFILSYDILSLLGGVAIRLRHTVKHSVKAEHKVIAYAPVCVCIFCT